ncbi:FMN-binding glutamate synthase family protein [Verminephrobacter eiseniae]|uniref:Ferredoxin-dependent glutamate synthase n=1 Tax=Verminephrobacter eiseniae (strain EF01-2) TaxID=391735 RepID=A1WMA7_VEREI|nr:FMN-binding glutamate synthase family protein [Verminephrobacter eiseniae]ABM58764.1 ferredoxin-dependent glutamate synthase [Verminephrobacter eiseniae EF01-2]MCW5284336.1 FMN-binding glutamate synthase family protein [Verminephrobacter eiseniae]MCW5302042.1 FMN-binding glutamate synthase family protein [Verminephrobacter eiseniae]MCW8179556.1 FMN-binding glutamate synthase family protein [Verminephrobacter eiseniae]MCW8191031.1 FMN-binding glutamate synthase family protein [Verminephrobac
MTAATQPSPDSTARTPPRFSANFDPAALAEIRRAAATGIYDIRGAGTKRRLPHFDDLLFLGASISRYPLEGYREKCATDVLLGARFARKPLHLQIPVTIAGMSFGALSANAKEALGRGASIAGTSTTTGDGGMTPEERGQSKTLVYQYLPSRYGMNPDHLRQADAIEIVVGQGAKPGGGGMLLGQKISPRVARMRCLPEGIDQRSACRHPDWTGPDDLEIKIHELREITDWEKPIYVKLGATRPYYDVALAVKAGADVVVLDGMQGGTAATQEVFIEHVGIPILAAIRPAVQALQDLGMHRKVQLIVSGGIRNGADVAKALALGADAVAIGTAALVALGDNDPRYEEEYRQLGSTAGAYDDWHEGKDPAGITTQDPALAARLDPVLAGRRLANYLAVLTMEAQIIARACGKSHLHHLEPEDLAALTLEAAAMTQIPLAGTAWYPGK